LSEKEESQLNARDRLLVLIGANVLALILSPVLRAQSAGQPEAAQAQTSATTPDFSGVWTQHAPPAARAYSLYAFTKEEPPMTPWAEARFKENKPSFGPRSVPDSNDPVNPTTGNSVGCFPPGVPRIYQHPFPMEIFQVPGRVIMFFEFDHYVRQIYTDGRGHNKDLPPTWMGDSIGRWEGDTLVVDTTGFNDKTWVDRGGHPHSEDLHLVERIRRVDHNNLQIDITFEDPKAYNKPWTGQQMFQLRPKWNIMELVCLDNVNFLDLANKLKAAPDKK
jgi:hypothetical protein